MRTRLVFSCWIALCAIGAISTTIADPLRALPDGQPPADARLRPPTTLNSYHPFAPPETVEAWQQRAQQLRRQLLVSQGLWPLPQPTPLNAVVHGRVERDDFTVERVYFESVPGFYVTGSLFRPKNRPGKLPAVLCPHGHWANGRFYDAGEKQIQQDLASGAERYERSGRYPLQARCVQLARMGCVVFHYDMIGYADSQQLAHRAGPRAEMNTPADWGFFSPQAELRLQSIMGLQTYDSLRALDFLLSLPDVDPARIGVTGASGGGTQTFMLCALDDRPAAAFPAVMVSTGMQGGCTCENANYLRIGTGNVEIAALTAPRPLGMTAADDWTKEIATKGLPELKQLYGLLGVPDNVMAESLLQFGHNYNYPSRVVMYGFMNKHLNLGASGPNVEEDFEPLSIAELTVWDSEHPQPTGGDEFERALLRQMTAASDAQFAVMTPRDALSLERYRAMVGGAYEAILGPAPMDVIVVDGSEKQVDHRDWTEMVFLAGEEKAGRQLPVLLLFSDKCDLRSYALWITPEGKQGLYTADGQPRAAVKRLMDAGHAVVGVDLFGQGEFLVGGRPLEGNRLVDRQHDGQPGYAGYTYGYNDPLVVKRAQDIVMVVASLTDGEARIDLVGEAEAAPYVMLAGTALRKQLRRLAIDTAGFRFAKLTATDDASFLPGAVRYGDVPGMLALAAPVDLWMAGEAEVPAIVTSAYEAADAGKNVTLFAGGEAEGESAMLEWLLRR